MFDLSAKELRTLIHTLSTEIQVFSERLAALDEELDEDSHSEIANDLQEAECLKDKIERKYKEIYG